MVRRQYHLDDSDSPTELNPQMFGHPQWRIRPVPLATSAFGVAALLSAWWVLDDEAGPTILRHPAWLVAVILLFATTLSLLVAVLVRDHQDRRTAQTEQLLRTWLVYKHTETRDEVTANVERLFRNLCDYRDQSDARNRADLRYMLEVVNGQYRDILHGLLVLEDAVPELLTHKEWRGFASALREVAGREVRPSDSESVGWLPEGMRGGGEDQGPRHARLRMVRDGAEQPGGRYLTPS